MMSYMIFTTHQYDSVDQMKKNDIGEVFDTHGKHINACRV